MDVRVEILPDILAVCMRHVGPYQECGPTFKRMYAWAAGVGALTPQTRIIGMSWDDPDTTPADQLRYDVCFSVAGDIEPMPDGARVETIPGGRYAVHTLKGPYSGIHPGFKHILNDWMAEHGERVAAKGWLEIYLNDPSDVPPENLLTDLCVPLQDQ